MPAPQTINHQYKSCAHVRIISILFIVTFLILVNLSLSTTRAIDNLNNEWHEYSAQTQHKFHLISQIRASLGYAGFIHHYKNYVIRRDANYLVQAKQSMTDTQRLLRQYLELPIHQEEMHALNGLATIMGNYKRKLQDFNHAQATRLSVSKLDERIHVDDRSAAEALATLNRHLENNYHKVKQQTDSLLNTAQSRVQILTWLGIPALIVFTLYSSYLVIRTTSAKNNLETLFSVIPDGLLVVDSRGKVIRANPKVSEIFGYSEDEIKSRSIRDLLDHGTIGDALSNPLSLVRTGSEHFYGTHKSGERLPLDIEVATFPDKKKAHTIAVIRSRKEELELKQRSETDHLTGTRNRSGIDRRFCSEIERSRRYQHDMSLILIDIDHFKPINDILRHQSGDNIIRVVAELLVTSSRPSDVIGRWGGDEFCIICPETNAEQAEDLARRLQLQLETFPIAHPETGNPPTLSIGISEFQPGDTQDSMFSRADAQLYKSKERGRNTISA